MKDVETVLKRYIPTQKRKYSQSGFREKPQMARHAAGP